MAHDCWNGIRRFAWPWAGLVVAAVAIASVPGNAAVPDRAAMVLWDGAAAVVSGTSPLTTVSVVAPGRYKVLFPGQGAPGGVVHVVAINSSPRWCQVEKWERSGPSLADEVLFLSCYRVGGALAPSAFTALFTASSGPSPDPGRYGYVDALPDGTIVSQFNSSGGANTVAKVAAGRWTVRLSGLGTPSPRAGSIQATAVNTGAGARCKVTNWSSTGSDQLVNVACYKAGGAPLDTQFTLSYQYKRSLFGATSPPKRVGYLLNIPPLGAAPTNFNSASAPNTLTSAGAGLSLATFPAIAMSPDTVQVTAFGAGTQFCGLNTTWRNFSGKVNVRDVNCFTTTGTPVNTGFLVSYDSGS